MVARRGVSVSVGLLTLVLCTVMGPADAVEVNPPLPTGTLVIAERVSISVELARSALEKTRGLSGRAALKPGHGMLFVYEQPQPIGIWMKDMRFALDILWILDGRIAHVEKNAPPLVPSGLERVYTATGEAVLEVPAGFADQQKIRVGDRVKLNLTQ